MSLSTAILAGLLVGVGLTLAIHGWLVPPTPRRRRPARRSRLSPGLRLRLGLGAAAGGIIFLSSGWLLAVAVVPAGIIGIPVLLGAPSRAPLERLEAMEEWTRSLAGVLTVGVGLEQAILATARSAPPAITREVTALAARITARTPTNVALRRFGDDLDDATGDLIVMSLLLGASRRGTGLSSVLNSLADSVAAEVRIRRAVEADRAKLRTAARWITGITLVVLGALFLNGAYVQPYRTPLGQLVLAVFLSAYAGALLWLRALAAGSPPPRLLSREAAP